MSFTRWTHRTGRLFVTIALAVSAAPCCAWACGGPAGTAVAISSDGNKYTVTNMGRTMLAITFTAWNQTYVLSLAPGQSGTPASSGWLNLPMKGYQSCSAVALPAR